MANQHYSIEGARNLRYSKMTTEDTSTEIPVYDVTGSKSIALLNSFNGERVVDIKSRISDDKLREVPTITHHNITIEVDQIALEDIAVLLGLESLEDAVYTEGTQTLYYETSDDTSPYVGISVTSPLSNGEFDGVKYPKFKVTNITSPRTTGDVAPATITGIATSVITKNVKNTISYRSRHAGDQDEFLTDFSPETMTQELLRQVRE